MLTSTPPPPSDAADDAGFSFRSIAVSAYGPSLLFAIGDGAVLPVIALTARHLGASVAQASLILALIGIFSLVSNIPSAMAIARYGERASLVGASVISVGALLLCIFAPNAWALAVGVAGIGVAASVFSLARQSYLIEVIPLSMRARGLSLLGGATRVGLFIGPFIGAGVIHLTGVAGAYWAALVAVAAAGVLSWMAPDLTHATPDSGGNSGGNSGGGARSGVLAALRSHWRVFLTLGIGVVMVSAMRASRLVVIPLWADHMRLAPATASLIYGFGATVDMLTFYPAGVVMDRHGRFWVALPSTLVMALAFIGIANADTIALFVLASLLLGFGNGIGSGIVMTMAADAAPVQNRPAFLGLWRVLSDTGTCLGPVLLSAMTAALTLGAGVLATGALGLVGAAVFWRWLPRRTG